MSYSQKQDEQSDQQRAAAKRNAAIAARDEEFRRAVVAKDIAEFRAAGGQRERQEREDYVNTVNSWMPSRFSSAYLPFGR